MIERLALTIALSPKERGYAWRLVVALAVLCWPADLARAQTTTIATVTVTNAANTNYYISINGQVRIFTNPVTSYNTQIQVDTNQTIGGTASNLYNAFIGVQQPQVTVSVPMYLTNILVTNGAMVFTNTNYVSATNQVQFLSIAGTPAVVTFGSNWATVSYAGPAPTPTNAYSMRVPVSAVGATEQSNNQVGIVQYLNLSNYSGTNVINPSNPIWTNFAASGGGFNPTNPVLYGHVKITNSTQIDNYNPSGGGGNLVNYFFGTNRVIYWDFQVSDPSAGGTVQWGYPGMDFVWQLDTNGDTEQNGSAVATIFYGSGSGLTNYPILAGTPNVTITQLTNGTSIGVTGGGGGSTTLAAVNNTNELNAITLTTNGVTGLVTVSNGPSGADSGNIFGAGNTFISPNNLGVGNFILSGQSNNLTDFTASTNYPSLYFCGIVDGKQNLIGAFSSGDNAAMWNNVILSGIGNTFTMISTNPLASNGYNAIVSGYNGTISGSVWYSSILAGTGNTIAGTAGSTPTVLNSAVLNGYNNEIENLSGNVVSNSLAWGVGATVTNSNATLINNSSTAHSSVQDNRFDVYAPNGIYFNGTNINNGANLTNLQGSVTLTGLSTGTFLLNLGPSESLYINGSLVSSGGAYPLINEGTNLIVLVGPSGKPTGSTWQPATLGPNMLSGSNYDGAFVVYVTNGATYFVNPAFTNGEEIYETNNTVIQTTNALYFTVTGSTGLTVNLVLFPFSGGGHQTVYSTVQLVTKSAPLSGGSSYVTFSPGGATLTFPQLQASWIVSTNQPVTNGSVTVDAKINFAIGNTAGNATLAVVLKTNAFDGNVETNLFGEGALTALAESNNYVWTGVLHSNDVVNLVPSNGVVTILNSTETPH